jgi:putative DNA primase/helicase
VKRSFSAELINEYLKSQSAAEVPEIVNESPAHESPVGTPVENATEVAPEQSEAITPECVPEETTASPCTSESPIEAGRTFTEAEIEASIQKHERRYSPPRPGSRAPQRRRSGRRELQLINDAIRRLDQPDDAVGSPRRLKSPSGAARHGRMLNEAPQRIGEKPIVGAAVPDEGTSGGEGSDLTSYLPNDHGNSQRLLVLHEQDLHYCHAFRKWLVWDGRRWLTDEIGRAEKLAKKTALAFLDEALERGNVDAEKFAKQSLEERRIRSALASTECELPITPAELDTHKHLLNFRNGTLDLRTGELRPHRREEFITKLVHYNYTCEADCSQFLQFLARLMGNHPDASEGELDRAERLTAYLQKAFGYSLTGFTGEKAVFFLYGSGNNGKSTLLTTFRDLIDEYAALLQVDTLMVRQECNNTQADLADLRGARFAMTSETEEGQRLAEGKLKRITQGMGKVKATRKYENPIVFEESHKLWMDCNHRPIMRGFDDALWNRIHAIPFTVRIPDEEVDRDMKSKLLAEAEGILAWAAEGAVRWFREGLDRPLEVTEAVTDYRQEMDQIGRFLTERCVQFPTAQVKADRLYRAYVDWAESGHEYVLSKNAFGRRLSEREIERTRGEKRCYLGLELNVTDANDAS